MNTCSTRRYTGCRSHGNGRSLTAAFASRALRIRPRFEESRTTPFGTRLNLALSEPTILSFQWSGNGADLLQIAVEGINEVIAHQPVMDELPTSLTRDQAGILPGHHAEQGGNARRDARPIGRIEHKSVSIQACLELRVCQHVVNAGRDQSGNRQSKQPSHQDA